MAIEELLTEMQAGFENVDAEFVAVRDDMKAGFRKVEAEFVAVRSEIAALRAESKAEAESTRRHFDVVAEDMKDVIKIVAETTAQNTQRLDNHGKRLTILEKPRRT